MGDRAPDGAARPDGKMTYPPRGLDEQGQPRRGQGRELDGPLSGHGPEGEMAVVLAQVGERADAVEIDEGGRAAETAVQERHQALPTGQDLGVPAVAGEETEGFVDGGGSVIVEPGRFHCSGDVDSG